MARELGPVASSQGGVQSWAKCDLNHSERDVQAVVKRQELSLKVPLTKSLVQGTVVLWIRPTDWLQYIVNTGQWCRLAGLEPAEQGKCTEVWAKFWGNYRVLHPDFSLFNRDIDLGRTAACFIHGDEGRSLKKQPLMITQWQSCLGAGFAKQRKRKREGGAQLRVNFAGDSLTNRFLVMVTPKGLYDKTPSFFHDCMALLADDLASLLATGVRDTSGAVYRLCITGVKGDWPYLQKNGKLQRSFNNVVKVSHAVQKTSICHLCRAGAADANAPWELFGLRQPKWAPTQGEELPWDHDDPPELIKKLPHSASHPEQYFHMDLWHCMHLGAGRTFAASVIVLCSDLFPGNSIPKRFEELTNHYLNFCKNQQRPPYLTRITQDKVCWKKTTDMPAGKWNKGCVTTNILLWLEALLAEREPNLPGDNILRKCLQALQHVNRFHRMIYSCDAFIHGTLGQFLSNDLREFLRLYRELVRDTFNQGRRLFGLMPKLHALDHVAFRLDSQSCQFGMSESPLMAGCQQDEDFIGKPSRLSRRVNIRSLVQRTYERYLISARTAWVKAGMLSDP